LSFGEVYYNSYYDYYFFGYVPIGSKAYRVESSGELKWFSRVTLEELFSEIDKELKTPRKLQYDLKIFSTDKVLESKTDKRGYPKSCGIQNANKDIIVIIRGD
jgi:hypothetical protein